MKLENILLLLKAFVEGGVGEEVGQNKLDENILTGWFCLKYS